MTAEQLEAARSERMRQNGHGAITIEDVRTWIEETGLCIFLPRSAQAGFTAPTFVEAVAGERTTEPTLELIREAESLLVRLESEGVAVRLNLAGQPGDQPDYVVAGWVLPYIYALRGDRDWRRSPQLTGSRQVSPLAVQVAKHLDSANLTAIQLRDALGRETSETAVLRALHELWKQLRVIPVVPELGKPAAWQPLRQRFQKAIAEGASTSQVTAISVLASIYLQAVIAASMEDVELFLAPLTSRSKIREVVRGLAATRQVHSTAMGHAPLFYVAGTLPEFPAVPSYAATPQSSYRSSSYRTPSYTAPYVDEYLDGGDGAKLDLPVADDATEAVAEIAAETAPAVQHTAHQHAEPAPVRRASAPAPAKPAAHRPRPAKTTHPRERSRSAATDDRRRAPAPRNGGHGNASRPAASSNGRNSFSNGNGNHANGSNGHSKPAGAAKNGHKPSAPARGAWNNGQTNGHANGAKAANGSRPAARPDGRKDGRVAPRNGNSNGHSANGHAAASKAGKSVSANGRKAAPARPVAKSAAKPAARPTSRPRPAETGKRKPAAASASASKRYSFAGQAKQAPKPNAKRASSSKPASRSSVRPGPAASKRRG